MKADLPVFSTADKTVHMIGSGVIESGPDVTIQAIVVGYMIRSGVIESACKHVVGERCPQAGPRWDKPGINAALKWRCSLKNENWEEYWGCVKFLALNCLNRGLSRITRIVEFDSYHSMARCYS